MLSVKNLNFGWADNLILKDIDFSLSPGESICLTGANGSGKTTLSFLLAGILKPVHGDVLLDGISVFSEQSRRRCVEKIGYVFQNPLDGLVGTTVERELAFRGENLGIRKEQIRNRVEEILEKFGLERYRNIPPHKLSGGFQARLAIASALMFSGEYLILDEPESFLDLDAVKIFKDALLSISHDSGIFFITQYPLVMKWFKKKYVIKNAKFCEYEDELIWQIPARVSTPSTETILIAENVTTGYNDNSVIENISIELHSGEILGIFGPNGSGKTTLALTLSGLLKEWSGKVERIGRVAFVSQYPERQLFAQTVFDDVLFGPRKLHLESAEQLARNALNSLQVPENIWSYSPFELANGIQRKVGIAGVIATEPDIIIFDEPFASLDADNIRLICSAINLQAEQGKGVILISHRSEILKRLAHRVVIIENGRVKKIGRANECLSSVIDPFFEDGYFSAVDTDKSERK